MKETYYSGSGFVLGVLFAWAVAPARRRSLRGDRPVRFSPRAATSAKPYAVRYFERAVMEYHPEVLPGAHHDVLLSAARLEQSQRRFSNVEPV